MKRQGLTKPYAELTLLQRSRQPYPTDPGRTLLETFANPHPGRDYVVRFDCPEFTSMCPVTGQPDFGRIVIEYVPNRRCVESKALKLYLGAYRMHGAFAEAIVNRILNDLVAACRPRRAIVTGDFAPRGGIALRVTAAYPR